LTFNIAGMGKYLPENVVSSADLERRLKLAPHWIARRTGVLERRHAQGETQAYMAARAVQMALEQAGLELSDVDALIGANAAPQQTIPCTAALVQRELGALTKGTLEGSACWDINSTCLSFLVALHTAALYLSSGVYKTIVVFSSERASSALNWQQPESAVLFGDAAAAVVLTRGGPGRPCHLRGVRFATFSSGAEHTRIQGGGTRYPPNDPATSPSMNLFDMNGPAIFRQAARLMPPFLDALLEDAAWTKGAVDVVVPHQASGHALEHLVRGLGFRHEQVFSNLAVRGNCVAASIPLALVEADEAGLLEPHEGGPKKVLCLGTAAGLMLGGLALELGHSATSRENP